MNNLLLLALTILTAYFLNEITTDDAKTIKSSYIKSDFALTADPGAQHWKNIKGVIADRGPRGDLTPGHRTEIRSRWSQKNHYLLFICTYKDTYLILNPSPT